MQCTVACAWAHACICVLSGLTNKPSEANTIRDRAKNVSLYTKWALTVAVFETSAFCISNWELRQSCTMWNHLHGTVGRWHAVKYLHVLYVGGANSTTWDPRCWNASTTGYCYLFIYTNCIRKFQYRRINIITRRRICNVLHH